MKKFLSSLFSFLLISLLVFPCACSSTPTESSTYTEYSKHRVSDTTLLNTEVFLDKPDSTVCVYEGTEKTLSDAEQSDVYDAFSKLMQQLTQTTTYKMHFRLEYIYEWREKNISLEFRYNQRRNYTGALPNESESISYFTWGNLTFDAFLLVLQPDSVVAVPYLGNSYIDINNLFLVLLFPQEAHTAFSDAVKNICFNN